jgi:hypothetical protein
MPEFAVQTGVSVFTEWLAATGRTPVGPEARLDAVAAFAGLDPALGWAGNLRRRTGPRLAIRRGAMAWSYDRIAASDADWRAAAGERAEGTFRELVRVVADHLLHADTRPDDILVWRGDPADPWPFALLVIGATLVLPPPPGHGA